MDWFITDDFYGQQAVNWMDRLAKGDAPVHWFMIQSSVNAGDLPGQTMAKQCQTPKKMDVFYTNGQ